MDTNMSDSESSIQLVTDVECKSDDKKDENLNKSSLETDTSMLMDTSDIHNDSNLNKSIKTPGGLDSAKKRSRNENSKREREREQARLKREEEKRKRDEEKEKQRLEKLEEMKKKEEERERIKLEKLEEIKKKKEEMEKLRLQKLEELKKKDEEKRKLAEEREKLRQEKLEKEKKRVEAINALKEEKKRKEEEKLKEEEEKKRKTEKVKQQFCSFFIKKEGPRQNKEEDDKPSMFMPFQLKSNMYLAPICRRLNYDQEEKAQLIENFDKTFTDQSCENTYLKELKHLHKPRNWPDTIKLYDFNNQECIEINATAHKFRIKYLHFDPKEYRRPPYYGTWRKKSKFIRAKTPFAKDTTLIDYEIDSDEEWEDEGEGESIEKSGDEDELGEELEEDDDDDGFFVPHGHLSDDEIDEENRIHEPQIKEAQELIKRQQWESERKKNLKSILTKFAGCIWKSTHPEFDKLKKFQMVPLNSTLPIQISIINENQKADEQQKSNKSKSDHNNLSASASSSPATKSRSRTKTNPNAQLLNKDSNSNGAATTEQSSPSVQNKSQTPSILKFISKSANKKDEKKEILLIPINAANTNEQTSSQTATTTPSILKFISKAASKKDDAQATEQPTPAATQTIAEKRGHTDEDENKVKRLKLDNTSLNSPKTNIKQSKLNLNSTDSTTTSTNSSIDENLKNNKENQNVDCILLD